MNRDDDNALLIAALASGKTHRDAAREAGVGLSTVTRRLRDPAFIAEVAAARRQLLDDAIGQLSRSASAAATTLAALLNARSEGVRLAAARAILDTLLRNREQNELEQRIALLEALAKELEASHAPNA